MKIALRLTLWVIIFPPLFFYEVNKKYNSVSFPLVCPKRWIMFKRNLMAWKLLKAFELFWSAWNPILTKTITRHVYKFAGGNKYPIFATLVTFVYSGIFLHGANPVLIWILIGSTICHLIFGTSILCEFLLKTLLFGTILFTAIGIIVATSKFLNKKRHFSSI